MYFEGRYTTDYRLTMTGCVIVSMPLLVVFLLFQKRFVRGFIGGAFK
jgi:raffinose/stachyose/melibiose transport system permease protein